MTTIETMRDGYGDKITVIPCARMGVAGEVIVNFEAKGTGERVSVDMALAPDLAREFVRMLDRATSRVEILNREVPRPPGV